MQGWTPKLVGKQKEKPKWPLVGGAERPQNDMIQTVPLKVFNSVLEQFWAYLQSSSPFLLPFYKNGCHVSCGYESVQGFSKHHITNGTPHNVPCRRQCTAGFCHAEWLLRLGRPASPPRLPTSLGVKNAWHIRPQVWKMGTQAPV